MRGSTLRFLIKPITELMTGLMFEVVFIFNKDWFNHRDSPYIKYEQHRETVPTYSTSLVSPRALPHCLQRLQNPKWLLGGPKMADGAGKVFTTLKKLRRYCSIFSCCGFTTKYQS